MHMLRQLCGTTRKDGARNEDIRGDLHGQPQWKRNKYCLRLFRDVHEIRNRRLTHSIEVLQVQEAGMWGKVNSKTE